MKSRSSSIVPRGQLRTFQIHVSDAIHVPQLTEHAHTNAEREVSSAACMLHVDEARPLRTTVQDRDGKYPGLASSSDLSRGVCYPWLLQAGAFRGFRPLLDRVLVERLAPEAVSDFSSWDCVHQP